MKVQIETLTDSDDGETVLDLTFWTIQCCDAFVEYVSETYSRDELYIPYFEGATNHVSIWVGDYADIIETAACAFAAGWSRH